MEPFYLMFYHDDQGQVRYFYVVDEIEVISNEILERLIDQLSRSDEDELRLRLRIEEQLKINKEKSGGSKKRKRWSTDKYSGLRVFFLDLILYFGF